MVRRIPTLKTLEIFAKELSCNFKGGEIVALIGDLGAGKTTFTKLFLKASGVRKKVTSPTFVLMIPYQKKSCTYYHMDLYRLNSYKDVEALGVTDLWGKKENIFLIEWADKIKRHLPKKTIYLHFSGIGKDRKVTLKNVPKNFEI